MKPALRIRDNLEFQILYSWPNLPMPKPVKNPALKFEREQAKMDKDRRLWFNRMTWGMCGR